MTARPNRPLNKLLKPAACLLALWLVQANAQTESGNFLEEIVIKALKRDRSLQDVPAAVTVLSASAIEQQNITRPADFIEVLKGPQGYLYGRNAIAGAIVITTYEPGNEFAGKASFGQGKGEESRARFSVGGPVVEDRLFIRASGAYIDREGFYRNVTRQDFEDPFNEKSGRLRLLYKPADALKIDLRAASSRVSGGATQFSPQTQIAALQTSPQAANIDVNDVHDIPFVRNVQGRNKQEKNSFSARIDWTSGAGALTGVTAYDDILDVFASDNFPYAATRDTTQFNVVSHQAWSQEIRFVSPVDQRLRYIVGAYYTAIDNAPNIHAAIGVDPGGFVLDAFTPIPAGQPNETVSFISDDVETEAWAVFAIVNWDLTDDLELTLAGRFDSEARQTEDVSPPRFSPSSGERRAQTFEAFQPKINLTWQANSAWMVYGGYARGFQAGGFNGTQTFARSGGTAPNDFGASTADNFEIGFKSTVLGGDLILNGAAFHNSKENAQQFRFIPAGTLNAVTVIDEIVLIGFELEAAAKLADNLNLSAGLGYIDARARYAYPAGRLPQAPRIGDLLNRQGNSSGSCCIAQFTVARKR